jgi:3-hydroxyisobutyrate dehydrogenase-like beta-hydroxyacid dehydrogenase
MCKNLVEKGQLQSPLILYNRTTSRAVALAKSLSNCTVATTIADAVQPADIIFLCLGNDEAVEQTVQAALEGGDITGKLIVDCSTVYPDTTRKINEIVRARGAAFVACPVFGSPPFADSGVLVCVPTGPKEDVDKVKPYTVGVMGRADIDFSDREVGMATTMKLLGNTYILSTIETLAEGMVLAEKSGLGTEAMERFMELFSPGVFHKYAIRMQSGDYHQREVPLFAISLARKDLRHVMNLAKDAGTRLRSVEVADDYMKEVAAHAGDRGDVAGLYGAIRMEAGLKYENN